MGIVISIPIAVTFQKVWILQAEMQIKLNFEERRTAQSTERRYSDLWHWNFV
jgi:hypothetical protein